MMLSTAALLGCIDARGGNLPPAGRSSTIGGASGASGASIGAVQLPECAGSGSRRRTFPPGFRSHAGEEMGSGTLTAVASDKLVIETSLGAPLTFEWGGTSLQEEFEVGEAVTYAQRSRWAVVRTPRRTAAAQVDMGFLRTFQADQIPDGPSFEPVAACKTSRGSTSHRLHASLDGESVDIDEGHTEPLGAFRIQNAAYSSFACPTGQPAGTVCDPGYLVAVFALGPGQ